MIDRGMRRCVILMFDCADRSCLRVVQVCGRVLDGEVDVDVDVDVDMNIDLADELLFV